MRGCMRSLTWRDGSIMFRTVPPRGGTMAETRTARSAPRNLNQLAQMEIAVRSDYAAWCTGWDNVCEQLSLIASGVEDELYMRLAANAGSNYTARAKARRA